MVRQLAPLVDTGLLAVVRGNETLYRLALPTRQLRLAAVFAAYRREAGGGATTVPARTSHLRDRLARANEADLADETLADWLSGVDSMSATDPARERVTDDQLDRPLTRG